MSLSEIITDSIKYPFSDITNFFIVGILTLLAGLSTVLAAFDVTEGALYFIGIIVSLIFSIIVSGYGLGVIRKAIENSDEFPMLDPVNNFIDGIKVIIIGIVFFIIPFIITFILMLITGAVGAGLDNLVAGLGFGAIIAVILFIIFAIFEIIAIARFAKTDEFGDAFNFGAIMEDIKRIGIAKIIAFLIVAFIVIFIAYIIISILAIIPFIGIIIAEIISGAFVLLFYNRGIGLLYDDA